MTISGLLTLAGYATDGAFVSNGIEAALNWDATFTAASAELSKVYTLVAADVTNDYNYVIIYWSDDPTDTIYLRNIQVTYHIKRTIS